MQKVYLLKCCAATILVLQSSLLATEISFSKTFETLLKPNKMQTGFSIIMRDKEQLPIRTFFDAMVNDLKDKQFICTGGEYSITPAYTYPQNAQPLFTNYNGSLGFRCEFSDILEFDKLIIYIEKNLDVNGTKKITREPIAWFLDAQEEEKHKEALVLKAIQHGKSQLKVFSEQLDGNCSLSKIRFAPQNYQPLAARMMSSAETLTTTAEPIKSEQRVQLRVGYEILCTPQVATLKQ